LEELGEEDIGRVKGYLIVLLGRIEEAIKDKDTKIFFQPLVMKALEILNKENSQEINEGTAEVIKKYCKNPNKIIKVLKLFSSSVKGGPEFTTLSSQVLSQKVNLPTAIKGEEEILLPTNRRGSELIRAINKNF
jgi:hypothetical protein